MIIFDGHLDIALNGVDWNRDLRQTVDDIRAQERSLNMMDAGRCNNTLSFPELKQSQVVVCLATLLARLEQPIDHTFGWTSPHACYAMAHSHLAYYRAMEQDGFLKILKNKQALTDHFSNHSLFPDHSQLGIIITMEGADPLLSPDTIFEFYEAGLRALGLTHYGCNRYGGGTRSEVGLSLDAEPLLRNCEQLGITIDMTHLSDVAFWQVASRFHGRVHASHQNARAICNWQRQFSDDQIRFIIERDGVLGVSMDVIMLQEGYVRGVTAPEETLERAVDQIEYVIQLSKGSVRHVALGTDLDGGYGCEQTPADLNRYRDLQKLLQIMKNRGFTEIDIESIFYRNWLRFFSEVLPD